MAATEPRPQPTTELDLLQTVSTRIGLRVAYDYAFERDEQPDAYRAARRTAAAGIQAAMLLARETGLDPMGRNWQDSLLLSVVTDELVTLPADEAQTELANG